MTTFANAQDSPIDDGISIILTTDEAIVFSDWLARTTEMGAPAPFEDQAEKRVLWGLAAKLESLLTEPLQPGYPVLLEEARNRIRDTVDE